MEQSQQPQLLKFGQLEPLKEKHPELVIEDQIALAIDELFDIEHPAKKDSKSKQEIGEYAQKLTDGNADDWGDWVYYPWLNQVVHFPPKSQLRALRTSRNQNLITAEEQSKLYSSTIMVIGMSVGSNVAEALAAHGVGGCLILVDMDIIEPSNLNRIRSPYHHVGLHKVEAVSRKLWEIDPYLQIVQLREGLNEANLPEALDKYRIDVLVDEMDDLRMKIILREAAKARRLPVVMAADDGDDALLDIERYDTDPDAVAFGGRIPEDILGRIKQGGIPRAELGVMIGKYFVGADNIPLRMYQSLAQVGKSLPSWPQLGGAAALSGVALAYIIRKILLGEKIRDGRVLLSLDEKISLAHLDSDHQAELDQYKRMMEG
ncbi:MAG TPA: ThiF family adenylyltransferase [Candidatus Saccharimonadales bacterium]|nr:ThiF family adenylyltransferase [Candidatus Saccharimonadales bacterium]